MCEYLSQRQLRCPSVSAPCNTKPFFLFPPSKNKTGSFSARHPSRRLTLPSSGPAFGGPLKSNVRPRFKTHRAIKSAGRCTAHARARRNLPQALHHRSVPPKPPGFFVIVGQAGCPVFAASARSHRFESEKCRAHLSASILSWCTAKTQSCSVLLSRAQAVPIRRIRAAQKCKPVSGAGGHANRHPSLGMLRHPNENTNTRQGCGSASVA